MANSRLLLIFAASFLMSPSSNAELIVPGTIFGVLHAHSLAAERFETRKRFVESHDIACTGERR